MNPIFVHSIYIDKKIEVYSENKEMEKQYKWSCTPAQTGYLNIKLITNHQIKSTTAGCVRVTG